MNLSIEKNTEVISVISKDRLVETFGDSFGACLYIFSFFSFPLAVYGVCKAFTWGAFGGIFAIMALLL
jgi:hypothetical protein